MITIKILNHYKHIKITTLWAIRFGIILMNIGWGEICGCGEGMEEVVGEYCSVVRHECKEWISRKRDRCKEYEIGSKCIGGVKEIRVCMDRYEWPNVEGEKPVVGMNYLEAAEKCASVGKRLCTAEEWTKGCEGEGNWPYVDGWVRGSCNVDKVYMDPTGRWEDYSGLWQGEESGSRPGCVSWYGVYDMVGNVDEWVFNEHSFTKNISGLKGGWWGPVRNRCRPITDGHNEWHRGYQIGFRCCKDMV